MSYQLQRKEEEKDRQTHSQTLHAITSLYDLYKEIQYLLEESQLGRRKITPL